MHSFFGEGAHKYLYKVYILVFSFTTFFCLISKGTTAPIAFLQPLLEQNSTSSIPVWEYQRSRYLTYFLLRQHRMFPANLKLNLPGVV